MTNKEAFAIAYNKKIERKRNIEAWKRLGYDVKHYPDGGWIATKGGLK